MANVFRIEHPAHVFSWKSAIESPGLPSGHVGQHSQPPPGRCRVDQDARRKSRQPVSRLKAGPIVVELRCEIVQQVLVQEAARTTQPSSLLQSEACIQGGEADHIACQSEGEYLACLKSLGGFPIIAGFAGIEECEAAYRGESGCLDSFDSAALRFLWRDCGSVERDPLLGRRRRH